MIIPKIKINNKNYSIQYLKNKLVYIELIEQSNHFYYFNKFCGFIGDITLSGDGINDIYDNFELQIWSLMPSEQVFDVYSNDILECKF
jgi:hypothetical protein